MSLNYAPSIVRAEDYERIFVREREQVYPMVDAFEERLGFALDRERLEAAARVLSCPLKAAPPNWQHGRVLYALTRRYLDGRPSFPVPVYRTLDIGTAKGFSALMVRWAVMDAFLDAQYGHEAYSVDVMGPMCVVRRNTIAEVDGLKSLYDILQPWPEARAIQFVESTGIEFLKRHPDRLHVVFVDGKHDGEIVLREGRLIADRQETDDVVMFDDVHIPALRAAVERLTMYRLEYLQVLPKRAYAIGVRR